MDKIIMKVCDFLTYNDNFKKRNPDLYDILFLLKTIFIAIPFLILFEIFVLIPYWFINLFKKWIHFIILFAIFITIFVFMPYLIIRLGQL